MQFESPEAAGKFVREVSGPRIKEALEVLRPLLTEYWDAEIAYNDDVMPDGTPRVENSVDELVDATLSDWSISMWLRAAAGLL